MRVATVGAVLACWLAAVAPAWGDDGDGDGVGGAADRCPDDVGAPPDGCPPVDTDGDGLLDRSDGCLADPGPRSNRGCPRAAATPERVRRLVAPALVGGRRGVLAAAARQVLRAAAADLAKLGVRHVVVVSVADHGLSYGDSIERARRVGELAAQVLVARGSLAGATVTVEARGPDGSPRLELRY